MKPPERLAARLLTGATGTVRLEGMPGNQCHFNFAQPMTFQPCADTLRISQSCGLRDFWPGRHSLADESNFPMLICIEITEAQNRCPIQPRNGESSQRNSQSAKGPLKK
jgi:hypothetical protein